MARFFIDRPGVRVGYRHPDHDGGGDFDIPPARWSSIRRIAPPVVTITAKYSGASAQTLEDTVAQVIEQKLNGIDGLLYINSDQRRRRAGLTSRLTFDRRYQSRTWRRCRCRTSSSLPLSCLPEEVTAAGHHRNQGGGQLPSDVRVRVVRRFHERGGPVRILWAPPSLTP